MEKRKHARLLIALSVFSALAMLGTTAAFADEGGGDRDDARTNTRAGSARLSMLINAINSDVNTLSRVRLDRDNDVDKPEDVHTVSLATIESKLSASDQSSLTNAVNANSGAVQSFLNGGSAQATAIDDALNAAGVAPSSALAVFPLRNGRLIVLTS